MSDAHRSKLSVLRCTLVGASVLAVLFALCWAAAAAGLPGGSHMYVSIFTLEPPMSLTALSIGVLWSIVSGGLTGALLATAYNGFAFVERRRRA